MEISGAKVAVLSYRWFNIFELQLSPATQVNKSLLIDMT